MRRVIALMASLLVGVVSNANTTPNSQEGAARAWMEPCGLLTRQVEGAHLSAAQQVQAARCLGAMQAVMAVNYMEPADVYLPFCEKDDDNPYEYAQIFLRAIVERPELADKSFGFALTVSLVRARPCPKEIAKKWGL